MLLLFIRLDASITVSLANCIMMETISLMWFEAFDVVCACNGSFLINAVENARTQKRDVIMKVCLP